MSINNDTVYSFAQLDLGAGAQLLDVPDVGDRYVVFQFVDAWTNNFAYLGRRATGPGAGQYLIAPPGWTGEPPAGVTVIASPTRICSIVGRFGCAGERDFPAVQAPQARLSLAALDADGGPARGVPEPDEAVAGELAFFEKLRLWMQEFPPAAADRQDQERFAPLGLLDPGGSPYVLPAPDLAAGLAAGRDRLERIARDPNQPVVNGWHAAIHACDYNMDWFEIGTIDDPSWKLADRAAARILRATVARGGLWGNHGYEAAYYIVFEDADGRQLNGASAYRLRFDQPPPCALLSSIAVDAVSRRVFSTSSRGTPGSGVTSMREAWPPGSSSCGGEHQVDLQPGATHATTT